MPVTKNWEEWSSRFPTNAELLLAQKSETVQPNWLAICSDDVGFQHDGVSVLFIKKNGVLRDFGKLSMALTTLKADVIHLHGLNRNIRLMYALGRWAQKHGVRGIVQDHGGGMPGFPLKRRFLQSALRLYPQAIFGDESSCKRWVDADLLHSSQTRILFAASTRFRPIADAERPKLRAGTGIQGSPVFGWVAHLNENKDPLTILKAFGSYVAGHPEARLYMHYRNDDLLDDCRKVIHSSRLMKENVHLLGSAPHAGLEPFFQSIDYLLQGSHSEAYGFAVAEAMASGAIPVVSDISSFRLLTGNGRFGHLFPVGNANALSELLNTLPVPGSSERERITRHFERNYSYPALASRLETIYRSE